MQVRLSSSTLAILLLGCRSFLAEASHTSCRRCSSGGGADYPLAQCFKGQQGCEDDAYDASSKCDLLQNDQLRVWPNPSGEQCWCPEGGDAFGITEGDGTCPEAYGIYCDGDCQSCQCYERPCPETCDYAYLCDSTLYMCWMTISPEDISHGIDLEEEVSNIEYCDNGVGGPVGGAAGGLELYDPDDPYGDEPTISCPGLCNTGAFPTTSTFPDGIIPVIGEQSVCPSGTLMKYFKICSQGEGYIPDAWGLLGRQDPSCGGSCPSDGFAGCTPPCFCEFDGSLEVTIYSEDGVMTKGGGARGDPHFQKWNGKFYDFHGICDLVLLHAETLSSGLGLDIHIRAKGRYQYSYIEAASVQIGEDVLQVGSWGEYWFNGVEGASTPALMGKRFPVVYHRENKKRQHFVITLDEATDESIVVSSFKDMVSVSVKNATFANFGASVGMMGNFTSGKLLARDGETVLEDRLNALGQEWQVLPTEPQLFETPSPFVNKACVPPQVSTEDRRRLEETIIPMEAAEKACSDYEGQKKDMCIFDVIAMGDLEVAEAGAF